MSMNREVDIVLQDSLSAHDALMRAINERHSVRQYEDKPLSEDVVSTLTAALEVLNDEGWLDMQLIVDEPKAFSCLSSKVTGFSGVKNYLAIIGPECPTLHEACGYYGEKMVLLAQHLGLNTCWVGKTFKIQQAYRLTMGEELTSVIALGYGKDQGSPHKSKSPQEVAPGYDDAPDWFKAGVDAALLAPTALNRQRFRFKIVGQDEEGLPVVKASTKPGSFTKIDLGIAKCHFEIAARPGTFAWKA